MFFHFGEEPAPLNRVFCGRIPNMNRKKRRALALALLLCFCFPPALADVETEISPLPWDDTPGYLPDPAGFAPDGYHDESIDVRVVNVRRADAEFYAAFVEIKHPSQLRTGLAQSLGSQREHPSAMAAHYQAVVAMNGDYYLDKERDQSLTIRQGVTLNDHVSKLYDILLIDTNGDFHIVKRDNQQMLDVYLSGALTIQNAFSFGPALVVDGQLQEIPEKYSFAPHYKNPRAAIGQLGPLSYVLVVVDGRQADSQGVTLEVLAQYMADAGCQQAFNLDGGGSATLLLDGEIYNKRFTESERSISDIVYFASYVDPLVWRGDPGTETEGDG